MKQDTYKGLIEQLLPLYNKAEFEPLLIDLTKGEPSSTPLLVKMEVKRLMTKTRRLVDLRGKVKGDCRPFILHGLTHWLDDVAINLYHQKIDIYGEEMTVGLFEELNNTPNHFKVLQKQPTTPDNKEPSSPSTDDPLQATPLRFGHYLSRSESRLQLSSAIRVILPDGCEVHGTTCDLSNSGIRVKLPFAFRYEIGTIITVYFNELADECRLPALFEGMDYRIVGVDEPGENDTYTQLRLRLLTGTSALKQAIELKSRDPEFTHRENNEDKVLTLRSRAFEQSFLNNTATLPLFFSGSIMKYCLLTEQNRSIWQYWHDERNLPVLNQLFNSKRFESLTFEGLKSYQTLVYCFSHEHCQKTYFLSACPTELNQEQRRLFWHIGSSRPSWRVLRVTVSRIDQHDIDRLQEVSPAFIDRIDDLTHVVQVQDLTLKKTTTDFRHPAKPAMPAKALNAFLHSRNPGKGIEVIPPSLTPQRHEPRYCHKTRLAITYLGGDISGTSLENLSIENQSIEGQSIDFSSRGLSLYLNEPFPGCREALVSVTYTDMKRVDPNAPLEDVPYSVIKMSADRRRLHLQMKTDRQTEERRRYLQRLIAHNAGKLTLDSEELPDPPLVSAMHQMLLTRLTTTPLFIASDHGKLSVAALGTNYPSNELNRLLEQAGSQSFSSLAPVFGNKLALRCLDITRHNNAKPQARQEYYIAAKFNGTELAGFKAKTVEEFKSLEERRMFIDVAKRNGKFFAVRNRLLPVNDRNMQLSKGLMKQLAKDSPRKARQLEQDFSRLCIFGELADITDEVLMRLEMG